MYSGVSFFLYLLHRAKLGMAGFARGPAFRLVARVRLEIRSLTRPLAILLAAGGVGTLYTNDSNSAPQPAIENPDERKLVTAVRKSLERKEAGQTNPEVTRIERGSIVVELVCHTEQSFLRFMEDFETGKIKDKLEEEFGNIDVTIINRDEVQQNVNAIRYL